MSKFLKLFGAFGTALVLCGMFLGGCGQESEMKQPSSIGQISFEEQRIRGIRDHSIEGNRMIRSYEELTETLGDALDSPENVYEKYDLEYFEDNLLILCAYWATDARIERRTEKISVDEDSVHVEIAEILPKDITVSDSGEVILNTDCYFMSTLLQVQKSDIGDIQTVEVSFRTTQQE